MSTAPGSDGDRTDGSAAVPPPADDRPVVDGTAMSPEELRAEVAKLTDERRAHVDEQRERVGDTVEALAARLDGGARRAGRRLVTGVGAAVAAATVLLLVLARRRRGTAGHG